MKPVIRAYLQARSGQDTVDDEIAYAALAR